MEQFASLPFEFLFDPAMIVVAILLTGLLVSGLAARMIELVEDRLPSRPTDSERTIAEPDPATSLHRRGSLTTSR